MKRKTLTTALLAGLTGTVGIANISNAVNLNPDGLGGALIYPYYTVRGNTDTLVTVVNTREEVKAVKVRFLEAYNSREVLDFNLYLSPFDVWVGAVFDNGTGGQLVSPDLSCTVPDVPSDPANSDAAFRAFAYTGDFADGGPTTLDRTREGYLEILEMGVVTDPSLAAAATHVGGVPADCGALAAAFGGGGFWAVNPNNGVSEPTGGLFGGAMLVNVNNGWLASYNADAIAEWSSIPLHTVPGSLDPGLDDTNSGGLGVTTNVFYQGGVVTSTWSTGFEAVSALYMHNAIMNTYNLEAGVSAGTDWVITFPTKRFHADPGTNALAPVPPFTVAFSDAGGGSACEPVSLNIFNREEQTTTQPLDFSPQPPQGSNVLCFEVSVLTFNNSNVLSSPLTEFTNVPSDFENGWLQVSFDDPANSMTSTDGDTYFGLPSTGFAVQLLNNGTLTNDEGASVLSAYTALFNHRQTRLISASAP